MIAIFPELVNLARSADLEKLAVMTRRYYGREDTFRPQPDVEGLLRHAGIRVERLPHASEATLLAKDEHGKFVIIAIIQPDLEPAVARFLLAHQLGHYLLDIQPLIAQGDWQVSGFRESQCPSRRYAAGEPPAPAQAFDARREARADAFAAALLMPIGMVRKAYERLRDPERLAQFFGVTTSVVMQRLELLSLGNFAGPRSFLDAEARLAASGSYEPVAAEVNVDELAQSAPLLAPPRMPRSFAAASYGQTDRRTRGLSPLTAEAGDEISLTDVASRRKTQRQNEMSATVPEKSLASSPSEPQAAIDSLLPHSAVNQGYRQEAILSRERSKETSPPARGMARIRELAQRLEQDRLKRRPEHTAKDP